MKIGDASFIGLDESKDPSKLDDGFYSVGTNTRNYRGEIGNRGGHVPVQWTSLSGYDETPPLLGNVYGGVKYTVDGGKKAALVFGSTKAWLLQAGNLLVEVAYPVGETVSSEVFALQVQNKVVVFRGKDIVPLIFSYTEGSLGCAKAVSDEEDPLEDGYIRMPWGSFALWVDDRLVVLKEDNLYPSLKGNIDAYDPANAIPVAEGSEDIATGVLSLENARLLVTRTKSCFLVEGFSGDLSGIGVSRIPGEGGCVAPEAVVTLNGAVLLPGYDGIFPLGRIADTRFQIDAEDFSRGIYESYRQANWRYFSKSKIVAFEGLLFLAFPTGSSTENNRVAVYDTAYKAWVGVDTFSSEYNPACFFSLDEGGKEILFAVSYTGKVYRYGYNIDSCFDGLESEADSTTPMEFVSRGYIIGERSKVSSGEVLLKGLNPKYSIAVSSSADTPEEVLVAEKATWNREKFLKIGVPDFAKGNDNLDHDNPFKEDYAVSLGEASFLVDNTNGNNIFQYQEHPHGFVSSANGRYCRIAVRNYRGGIRILRIVSGIEEEGSPLVSK